MLSTCNAGCPGDLAVAWRGEGGDTPALPWGLDYGLNSDEKDSAALGLAVLRKVGAGKGEL